MSNFNKVILIGRLTHDAVLRHTPKGTACTDVSLAVNRSYTTEAGEKREETTFVDTTFWGKTAEIAGKYLSKGNLTCVEGRLKMDTWNDKATGQARSKLTVVGDNMVFLEPSSSSGQRTSSSKPKPGSKGVADSVGEENDYGQEEPF